MGKFATLFKSKNILLAIGLIILIFLVAYLGSVIRISWLMRIAIIIFILLIVVILILFKKMKDAQKASQIEQSISESDSQILSPEKRAEIDQFKKQLEAAISALKNSKLGRGKSGKAALYSLPWYMIIGPSAAGKTTAIQNSGLEFPYGKDSIKGVGGTRNCDWFFSTRAIFLDTAGRYLSETEDRPEWVAFLETLKKNRKKKPVNGVIIALNIDEIIKSENTQLKEHAKNIRSRIDELIENLGVVFPVYFVFTKCDLIQGFVEYFCDFSETERSQIWGATFTPQQQLDQNPKFIFETEFNKLAEVIYNARIIRLSNPLKREQRRKVFLFPFQFSSLKEKLTYLIGELFQPNPYQDNPIFRGFYFTSGTQEGAPLDLAIKEIAKQFNLPAAQGEEFEEIMETKHYFIKDLLNDVVISDQNYAAGQAATVIKQNRLIRNITLAASAAFLFIFGILIFWGYNGSANALDDISSNAKSISELNWEGDLLNNFTKAESLRRLLIKVKQGNLNESILSFRLDRSEGMLESITELYFKKTEPFFTKYIYNVLVDSLKNYESGLEHSSEQIYDYLKAYLLIGDERSKLDTTTQIFLTQIFTDIFNDSKSINSNLNSLSAEKDSLKNLFRNYISFFVEQMKEKNFYAVQSDNWLINNVRSILLYKPTPESIYARMKENSRIQYSTESTFEQLIGGKSGQIMQTDSRIPDIFTVNGCRNYFQPRILDESKNPGREDWVTGKTHEQQSILSEFDSITMRKQLTDLYIKDYLQTWVQFLQSIKYSRFESVPYSANSLKILSDSANSPLVLVLKVFAEQMKAISDNQSLFDTANSSQTDLGSLSNSDIKRFTKFTIGFDDSPVLPDLNIVITQYAFINGVIEKIKGGEDLIKDFAIMSDEFQTSVKTIKNAANDVPEFQNLLINPINMSWRSILSDASSYLNDQWKSQVWDVYNNTLAESFPFSEKGSDAPIQDFDNFFSPQNGVLWRFFNSELGQFIKKGDLKVHKRGNQGISFSTEFISALNKADEISNIFFRGGNLSLAFRLKSKFPVSKEIGGKKEGLVYQLLTVDGEGENYEMGGKPIETVHIWPNNKGIPEAIIEIRPVNYPPKSLRYEGDWALFKLLNHASISRGDMASQIILTWKFLSVNQYDIDVSYILTSEGSKHPFSRDFFSLFILPKTVN